MADIIITPPENVEIMDFPTSTAWIDENNIFWSMSKPNKHKPSIEETRDQVRLIHELHDKYGPLNILSIMNHSSPPANKEVRDYVAEVLNETVNAWAMVIRRPFLRISINLFFGVKPPKYPVKVFKDIEPAEEWLMQKNKIIR